MLLALVHTRPQRELLEGVLHDLNKMLAHFIRAQLTLAALSGFRLQQLSGIDAVPNALMLWDAGWNARICSRLGPNRRGGDDPGRGCVDELPLLDMDSGVSRAVAPCAGLSRFPRIMGKSMELHPLAAIFGVLAGGGDRGRARRLSVDPGDGEFGYRMAPLATLRRKAQVWPSQRVFCSHRTFPPGNRLQLAFTGRARAERSFTLM